MDPNELIVGMRRIDHELFRGSIDEARNALADGANPNARRDYDGTTALHEAVHSPEKIKLLLEAGADVNGDDDRGYTPLHAAAGSGHAQSCQLLLEAGADPNARSSRTYKTPLHEAAGGMIKPDAIQRLVEGGADVNARDAYGDTPLHCSMMTSHGPDGDRVMSENTRALIDAGADPSIRDNEGRTALEVASDPEMRLQVQAYIADKLASQFERDTAAVLADNFNPNAAPEANAVPSDAEVPSRRQRLRL